MKLRIKTLSGIIFMVLVLLNISVRTQEIAEDLENFTEVKTFNGVEVVIIPSEENRIEITGHSKEEVKFEVTEGRLEIRLSLDHIWSQDNTLISIYGRNIETVDANEGSFVRVDKPLKSENLIFRAQEGANILGRAEAQEIEVKAVSGGKITLEGKATAQQVELNTGGQYFGRDLRTKETTITAGTAGRGEIYATDYCKATAKLGGSIEIFGNPDEVDHKTSLGGKIH